MKFTLSPQLVAFLSFFFFFELPAHCCQMLLNLLELTSCQDVISLSHRCATPAFPFIQTLVLLLLYLQSGPTDYASVTFAHTLRCNWGTTTLRQTSCVKRATNTPNCNHYSLLKAPHHQHHHNMKARAKGQVPAVREWESIGIWNAVLRKCILTALARSTLQHRRTTASTVGDDCFHSAYFLFCLQQKGFCLPGRGFILSEPSLSSTASFPNHS